MLLGGITGGTDFGTADDQLAPGPALSLHDQILEADTRVREARADYWALLAEADAQAGPSNGRHRNEALWLADARRVSKRSAGGDVKRGRLLHIDCPSLGEALRAGIINDDHVATFMRIWNKLALRAPFKRDLAGLIEIARNDWGTFERVIEAWEELVDPIDPNEYAERAHNDRSLTSSEPVSKQILVELLTTTAVWAQIEPALKAKANQLFEADWAEARARVGDNATAADLIRTDTQRRHDALLMFLRGGIGADDTLAKVVANILMDAETFREESERRDAENRGETPPPRSSTDPVRQAARRRCETESGLSLAPSDALDYAIAGHVRLFMANTKTGDFEASAKTRLFKGSKRLGVMFRDRHCQGAGCDTAAWHCEIDHTIRFEHGGRTVPTNGKPRCGPCHRHKTRLEMLGLWPPSP